MQTIVAIVVIMLLGRLAASAIDTTCFNRSVAQLSSAVQALSLSNASLVFDFTAATQVHQRAYAVVSHFLDFSLEDVDAGPGPAVEASQILGNAENITNSAVFTLLRSHDDQLAKATELFQLSKVSQKFQWRIVNAVNKTFADVFADYVECFQNDKCYRQMPEKNRTLVEVCAERDESLERMVKTGFSCNNAVKPSNDNEKRKTYLFDAALFLQFSLAAKLHIPICAKIQRQLYVPNPSERLEDISKCLIQQPAYKTSIQPVSTSTQSGSTTKARAMIERHLAKYDPTPLMEELDGHIIGRGFKDYLASGLHAACAINEAWVMSHSPQAPEGLDPQMQELNKKASGEILKLADIARGTQMDFLGVHDDLPFLLLLFKQAKNGDYADAMRDTSKQSLETLGKISTQLDEATSAIERIIQTVQGVANSLSKESVSIAPTMNPADDAVLKLSQYQKSEMRKLAAFVEYLASHNLTFARSTLVAAMYSYGVAFHVSLAFTGIDIMPLDEEVNATADAVNTLDLTVGIGTFLKIIDRAVKTIRSNGTSSNVSHAGIIGSIVGAIQMVKLMGEGLKYFEKCNASISKIMEPLVNRELPAENLETAIANLTSAAGNCLLDIAGCAVGNCHDKDHTLTSSNITEFVVYSLLEQRLENLKTRLAAETSYVLERPLAKIASSADAAGAISAIARMLDQMKRAWSYQPRQLRFFVNTLELIVNAANKDFQSIAESATNETIGLVMNKWKYLGHLASPEIARTKTAATVLGLFNEFHRMKVVPMLGSAQTKIPFANADKLKTEMHDQCFRLVEELNKMADRTSNAIKDSIEKDMTEQLEEARDVVDEI